MTRLITSGFELYVSNGTTNTAPDGTAFTATGMTRDTSVKRSGAASLLINVTNARAEVDYVPAAAFANERGYWCRMYMKLAALPNFNTQIMLLNIPSTGASFPRLNTDGTVCGSLATGTTSAALNDGNWHRIEYYWKVSATQANRAWELRVDGVTISSGSNQATVDAATPTFVSVGSINAVTFNGYFDDVAWNDDQGSFQNSWPGDGKVVLLKPNADNDRGSWTGGAGGTTSLFDALNNTPPTGATAPGTNTSQISANAVATTGKFDTTSYTTEGAVSGDTVLLCLIVACHGEQVATGTKSGSASTDTTVNNAPSSSTGTFNYGLDIGAEAAWPSNWRWSMGAAAQYTSQPTFSTGARLNIVTTTTSRVADCCFLGLYVELTPASGPTTWNGSSTVSLTDATTTAGTPQKLASSTTALVDARTTAGAPKKFAVSAVAETVGITTAGVVTTATTWTGTATVALTDNRTTAGSRQTFAVSAVQVTDAVTTAGTRTLRTSTTTALVVVRTTSGRLTAKASSTTALVNNRTTAGTRTTFAVTSAALTDARTTSGRLTAKAVATRPETVTVTTSGNVSTGAITIFGSASVQLADSRVTAGTRVTFGVISRVETVAVMVSARLTRFSSSTTAIVNVRTTAGTRTLKSATTVALVDSRTTAARLTAKAVVLRSETVGITTPGRVKMLGQVGTRLETVTIFTVGDKAGNRIGAVLVSLHDAITTAGARVFYGQSATAETVHVTTLGDRHAIGTSTVQLVDTIATSGVFIPMLPPGRILVPTTGSLATPTRGGRIAEDGEGYIDRPEQGVLAGTVR